MVLDIAVHRGLLLPSVFDDIDDGLDEIDTAGSDSAGAFVPPMEIRGVTGDSVIGAFNGATFSPAEIPAGTVSGLLEHARRSLSAHSWAEHVSLTADHDDVLIEAPDLATLERAAEAIGTSGPPSFAEDLVRVMREELRGGTRGRPAEDWRPRPPRSSGGSWMATGPVSDVTVVFVEGDPVRAGRILLDHLDSSGATAAERVDVTVEPDFTVQILGDTQADVQWVADELRRPPR